MSLYVTYCSKRKSDFEGHEPAIKKYQSSRIQDIYEKSVQDSQDFAILSGKYGLIDPQEEIPEYDKLLEEEDIEKISGLARIYLNQNQVSEVVYFTRPLKPVRKRYYDCIKKACEAEEIKLTMKTLEN